VREPKTITFRLAFFGGRECWGWNPEPSMVGKCFITELHPSSLAFKFLIKYKLYTYTAFAFCKICSK
jgi:hypothetical protein